MFRKFVLFVVCVMAAGATAAQFRNLHYYYNIRCDEFKRARLYLQTDVCLNGELASKLGDFSRCEAMKKILDIPPWITAWYDFLEDMYICGHGRCNAFWDEISGKLPYITFFIGLVLCYIAYQSIQTHRAENAAMYYQLPMMNPHLQMLPRHSHGD